MERRSIRAIVDALDRARVRYLVVGGVAVVAFADGAQRRAWALEKGMTVFSVFSPEHPATEIDLFLESPFDFESAYSRSVHMPLAGERSVTVVSLRDLLDLKRAAGRPDDLKDVLELESLHEDRESGDG